jgi:hypothetical protein
VGKGDESSIESIWVGLTEAVESGNDTGLKEVTHITSRATASGKAPPNPRKKLVSYRFDG